MPPRKPPTKKKTKKSFKKRLMEGSSSDNSSSLSESSYSDNESSYFKRKFKQTSGLARADIFKGEEKRNAAILRAVARDSPERYIDLYQPIGNRLNPKSLPRYVFQDLSSQTGINPDGTPYRHLTKATTITVPALLAFYSRHKISFDAKMAPAHAIGDFKALRRIIMVLSRRLRRKMFPQGLNTAIPGVSSVSSDFGADLTPNDTNLVKKYFAFFSPPSFISSPSSLTSNSMSDTPVPAPKHPYDDFSTTVNPPPSTLFFNNDLYNPNFSQIPIALPCEVTKKVFILPAWWVKEYYDELDRQYHDLHTNLMMKYPIPTALSTPPLIKSTQYVTNPDKTVESKEVIDIHPFFANFKLNDWENYNNERMKVYNTMINTILSKQQHALLTKYRFINSTQLPPTFNPPPYDPINGLYGLGCELSKVIGVQMGQEELKEVLIKNTLQMTPISLLHPLTPLDPSGANGPSPGEQDETMFTVLNRDFNAGNGRSTKLKTTKAIRLPQPKIQKGLMVNVLLHPHQAVKLPQLSTVLALENKWRGVYSTGELVEGMIPTPATPLSPSSLNIPNNTNPSLTPIAPILIPTGGYSMNEIETGVAMPTLPFSIRQPFSYPELGFLPFTRRQYRDIFAHPDWTLYETLALMHFVTKYQADSFYLVREDPILNVRHSWEGCLDRWLSLCAIAAAAGLVIDGAKLMLTSAYQSIDQRLAEIVMDNHYAAWENGNGGVSGLNGNSNSNVKPSRSNFLLKKQDFITATNIFDPALVEKSDEKVLNGVRVGDKAKDNSLIKSTPFGWVDQGWDVPVLLPIEYEPQSLAIPSLRINGVFPVQQLVGEEKKNSDDLTMMMAAASSTTSTPLSPSQSPHPITQSLSRSATQSLVPIDPNVPFLGSFRYQNDGCFINGKERFGIDLGSIPIPTDLFSQLKMPSTQSLSSQSIANTIETVRGYYSVGLTQHLDRGEHVLRSGGYTTTLTTPSSAFCPTSDPTNTAPTVLSTKAAQMSDIFGKFQQATSSGGLGSKNTNPDGTFNKKKGKKSSDFSGNDGNNSSSSNDRGNDDGDDSDDLPRSRRRNAPVRASVRAGIQRAQGSDESDDEHVVVAPRRASVGGAAAAAGAKSTPKKTPQNNQNNNTNENTDDDDDDEEEEDDDNDEDDDDEDDGPNYYDGDSDDDAMVNYPQRKKQAVVATDAKIDRILEEKEVKKRLIFRLDGHILTQSLSQYLVTAEKALDDDEKERLKKDSDSKLSIHPHSDPTASLVPTLDKTDEELEEERIEAAYAAYDTMLRSIVSEDFEDFDDFSINNIHPEFLDEYGYYDDSEVDEATGKKIKDLERELVEAEAAKVGMSFDDYLVKKKYDIDVLNGDTDVGFDVYLSEYWQNESVDNNNNNNNNHNNNNNSSSSSHNSSTSHHNNCTSTHPHQSRHNGPKNSDPNAMQDGNGGPNNNNGGDEGNDDDDGNFNQHLLPIPSTFAYLKKDTKTPPVDIIAVALANNTPISGFISDYLVNYLPPVAATAVLPTLPGTTIPTLTPPIAIEQHQNSAFAMADMNQVAQGDLNGQNNLNNNSGGEIDPTSTTTTSTSPSPSTPHPILNGYHNRFVPFPSDAITVQCPRMIYLIKDLNISYKASRWWSEFQMIARYSQKSTGDRLKRWANKKEDIMMENLDKYGGLPYEARYNEIDRFVSTSYRIYSLKSFLKLSFLPSHLTSLDVLSDCRLIPRQTGWRYTVSDPQRPDVNDVELLKTLNDAEFSLFTATQFSSSANPKENLEESEAPYQYDRIAVPCYLVKWQNLGYGLTSWEPKYMLLDEEHHIAQYNRFSKRPTVQQLQPRQLTPEQQQQRNARMNQWHDKSPFYKAGNTLRPYQVQGINWLIKCYITNKNGILADEMGLGKTVQCITFLEHLRREENNRGPFLVVAPLSTLSNWASEADTWTDMNCLLYHDATSGANGRALLRKYEFFYPGTNITKFNVLITSYEMLLTDVEELSKCQFKYAIIDEGHRLKNKTTRLMDAFAFLDIPRRLLLTGTPIQNNTTELWTLLNFLEPTKFNDEKAFKAKFGTVEGSEQAESLQKTINPYMLRRVKETVEKSIPKKVENIVNVELTRVQKLYYRAVYERNVAFLKAGAGVQNTPKLINIETELRKVCNHPWLVVGAEDKQIRDEQLRLIASGQMESEEQLLTQDERMALLIHASGKLGFLEKLLPKLKAQGERVLIFSQMVTMLNFLSEYLTYRGYKHERLDGSVNGDQRAAAIDRFTKPDSDRFAFLLSTRAGGVGLNLTSANVVIIFDSDWNPQQDIQAQARAHRIGQKNDVRIYRLITRGTYESEMFARASKKLGLDHAIMKNLEVNEKGQTTMEKKRGKAAISAGRQDIENLLRYGAYGILDNDEDEDRQRFFDADIDTILAQNTYQVNNHEKPPGAGLSFDGGLKEQEEAHKKDMEKYQKQMIQQQNTGGAGGHKAISHQKMFFTTEKDSLDLDMHDANFWTKILSASSDDYKYTKDALMSRLTVKKGSAQSLSTEEDKKQFFVDLEEGFNRVNQGRQDGKLEINDVDEFVSLLDMIVDRTATFNDEQRQKAQRWSDDLEKLSTRRVNNTTNTDAGYRFYSDSSGDDEDNEDEDNEDEDNDDDDVDDGETNGGRKTKIIMSKKLPPKKKFNRSNNSDSSDYEEHISSYKPRNKSSAGGTVKPGTRDPTEEEIAYLKGLMLPSTTTTSTTTPLKSTKSAPRRSHRHSDDDDDDDDDDNGGGNDLDVLVLKEKAGLDDDIFITIPRRGKGARPVQQHFVCSVCYCPGELIACDGLCCRLFHRGCVPKGAPKMGTLPLNITKLNQDSFIDPSASQTIFAPPEPCFVTESKLVPKSIEEANKYLKKAGKVLLPDDGKDYIEGPPGASEWYHPTRDPVKLQTTRWECAECLNQLWRCTLCKYPVQCVEPKKLDTGLTGDNAISNQKRAKAEVVRQKRLAARLAAGGRHQPGDDEKDEEKDDDDGDGDDGDKGIGNGDGDDDNNTPQGSNSNQDNDNEDLKNNDSESSSSSSSDSSDDDDINTNDTTEGNVVALSAAATRAQFAAALAASSSAGLAASCPDFVLWNHQHNITSPLNNNMSSVAFPHGGKFCTGQLCGKIAHVACLEQHEGFLQKEASIGNNPPKVRLWRCAQHGCTKCCSVGLENPVNKDRWLGIKKQLKIQDPDRIEKNDNYVLTPSPFDWADYLNTYIEVIPPQVDPKTGHALPFTPGTRTEIFTNQPSEGATTNLKVVVHENGSITKTTIVNEKATQSRQKATLANTVYPCLSCNKAFHMKCFPTDSSTYVRPSKRQIICPECTEVAQKTNFGQRTMLLAEWTYSISLTKDRLTIPMHSGPKRSDGLVTLMVKQGLPVPMIDGAAAVGHGPGRVARPKVSNLLPNGEPRPRGKPGPKPKPKPPIDLNAPPPTKRKQRAPRTPKAAKVSDDDSSGDSEAGAKKRPGRAKKVKRKNYSSESD